MVERIFNILPKMAVELRGANVPLPIFNIDDPNGFGQLPYAMIKEGYNWLIRVYTHEYLAVLKVRELCKPEIWERMLLLGGFEEHREMKMLRGAQKLFRATCVSRKRPDLFKRGVVRATINAAIKGAHQQSKNKGKKT